ncbi:PREDICTED: protein odr-4 homolog isoform X1 [Nelumbo nucifera]|uniref:Protein odr-4 homolog isoform X1 n=1 Tax=Nelumbo nucifera TaxID=4432 RepID=A0A1U7Z221_NELNU|nr:PREDICTED: protein odr-4 homolog isoform X1 [Nelumbo nucifera]
MVKAVVGEETQLNLAEDRLFQSEVPAQVGLVVGKLSSGLDRGFVFDLILTPPNDSGAPACSVPESGKDDKKKGSKGKSQVEPSSLLIDIDWVAEHARQVSRMLLGGMNVVGIYVWATESLFKASNVIIWQTVKEVAEAAPFYESKVDERLLIHISYSPRRWICRNCTVGSSITSSSLRPCDFKMGRVLSSLQTFKCMYNFEIRLPIFHDSPSNVGTFREVLCNRILQHAKELGGAKALINGNLVVEDEPCTTDGSHDVELLLPFIKDAPIEASSQKEVAGIVIFTGSICSFAYLSPKEPISQAIADIKGDIIMSLQSRLDIICDEAEDVTHSAIDDSEEASNEISTERPIPQHILQLLRKPCKLSFPRRVLIPWVASAFICDYLQPSDTFEVLKEHCKELMSMEAPTDTSSILEPETEATSLTTKSFWDAVLTRYSTSGSDYDSVRKMESDSAGKEINRESFKLTNFNFVAALVIVLLSILVGLVLPIFKA